MTQKNSRLIWVLLIGMSAFVAYLFSQNQSPEEEQKAKNSATLVNTQVVSLSSLVRQVSSLGTALANQSVHIVTNTSDYLTELHIREGQRVEKDHLIAQLNDVEERARVAELSATLLDQKRQLDRVKNLARTQATAQSLLDEQQTRVKTTQAQLDAVKARLNEMTIRAPFAGVLGLRQVSEGAYLTAGTVLTTLDDLNLIRLEFSVAEYYLAQLKAGMAVNASSVAYPGQVFKGEIKAIDTRLDPITRSVKVHALVPNGQLELRPGMLLNVSVILDEVQALQISEKAIVPLQNKHYVFVVNKDNNAIQTEVQLGQRMSGLVEIISGLNAGDEVVIEGTTKIRSGSLITKVGQ
ncbi:efflux RND transporter periplasmic adaptor subunit [Rheinheimera sediminis]|uniref:efflux RND transporter periplasmic adaptor subunit n=1 Tax=Rheinheimera sp. YQF-1 TaxID=2499626 RepID=UPI000FDAC507|nr:efflux RND transporter periplasmic adaptor subunit [Rheinheimera sp. YQF-1]RVT45882.1 efflux RND transporter periplasmic adaptor subunit [Rheinheimera sp. YQF-1]